MSRKRPSDPDDGEPWRPGRKAPARLLTPAEILPGVGRDDLPIADPSTADAIRKYEDMPVTRKLEWRMSPNGRPKRRQLTNAVSLAAAFTQTRGHEIPDPCSNCEKGLGPWETCVIMTNEEDSKLAGACANCQFSRRYDCSFRAIKLEDIADDDFGGVLEPTRKKKNSNSRISSYAPSNSSIGTDVENNKLQMGYAFLEEWKELLGPMIDDGPRPSRARSIKLMECQSIENAEISTDSKLQVPSSTPAENSSQPQSLETRVSLENDVFEKAQRETTVTTNSSSNLSKSKLDGSLLPFPLGPETFNNLPLLRQAERDMAKHLEAMRKRIRELEVKEQQKESYNPWDFI